MARLTLHIGTPKTGTTFLQQVIHASQPAMAEVDWYLPNFIKPRNHDCVPASFADLGRAKTSRYPELATLEGQQAMRDSLAADFAREVLPDSNWIVTSEGFTIRITTPQQVEAIRDYFGEWFTEMRVIVYLRRQDFMTKALYTEHLRENRQEFEDLGMTFIEYPQSRMDLLNHLATYRRWSTALGAEAVVVRPYLERYKSQADFLLTDFNTSIGMPLRRNEMASAEGKPRNLGFSAEAADFIKYVGATRFEVVTDPYRTYDDKLKDAVAAAIRAGCHAGPATPLPIRLDAFNTAASEILAGDPILVPQPILLDLDNRFASDNAELIAEIGGGAEWDEWLSQSSPPASTTPAIKKAKVYRVLKQIADGWPPPPRTPLKTRARQRAGRVKRAVKARI